ncbi:MAG: hypothetical protein LJE94_01165 [Deltaproteobacteria bacterium]|nr:hypothetical protein [Deltaproteobacteria bacterium]
MKRKPILAVILITAMVLAVQWNAVGAETKKPVDVTILTTPFGTPMYNIGAAMEQVFKKTGSWVRIKHQETPGAMYMLKYYKTNQHKMISGEMPWAITVGGALSMDFVAEGRPPLDKLAIPNYRAIMDGPAAIAFYGTFDPEIKSLKDMAGKKMGTVEPPRLFAGTLVEGPLFDHLGINDKIDWQRIGTTASKDGMLNGSIDAMRLLFIGKLKVAEDGSLYIPQMFPSPAAMELIGSGKTFHFLPIEREWTTAGFDYSRDVYVLPCRIKKGSFKTVDKEFWAQVSPLTITSIAELPDDIVEEIIRVAHQHHAAFGKIHAMLGFMPENPYPVGAPQHLVHPGVVKAMKKLNLPVPKLR